MAFDSLRDITQLDYINLALLGPPNNTPNLRNEPGRPKHNSNLNLGNGKEKRKLATAEEINERRKHGQTTRGPKSKAQGYRELNEEWSIKEIVQDRKENLPSSPLIRDPKNWFDIVSPHKSIEEQLRERKPVIDKEQELRIGWEKRLAEECNPLDAEWDEPQ